MQPPIDNERRGFSRRRLVALLAAVLLAGVVTADWYTAAPVDAVRNAEFVGRESCVRCHQQEHNDWQGSHHDHAMELATEDSVRGDFYDTSFERLGVTTKFFRRDGEYWVNTEGPDGNNHDYQIKYTFGWEPLQQYMVEFPDGRVQVLRVSWDTERKEWFYVSPPDAVDVRLPPDDPTHWTGIAQNWNTFCAECHSTNLQKNYELASDKYATTWSEIDVSCEECHGPGSLHVELAEATSLFWDRRHGKGLAQLKGVDNQPQIESCAKCHSRRELIHQPFRPGVAVCDQLRVSTLDETLYHADGQILDEVYVYGSFTQSLMYQKGVRCTDCHDPHSTRLKFEGNALCSQCHEPGKYDTPVHHHHTVGTAGASCVECHMPTTHYMVVDGRRDHSMRVPRPDLSVELGTPNACNSCHTKPEEDAAWAAKWVEDWYGPERAGTTNWAHAIAGGRRADPKSESLLSKLATRESTPAIVRATAINLLANYRSDSAEKAIRSQLDASDDLVRTAAVGSQPINTISEVRKLILPALDDSSRLVRLAAARRLVEILTSDPSFRGRLDDKQRRSMERAIDELRAELAISKERAGTHVQLAILAQADGDTKAAIDELRLAIKMAPYLTGPRRELANLLLANGGKREEVETLWREEVALLERDIEYTPEAPEAHYQLGLLSYKMGDMENAGRAFSQAVRLAPRGPRYLEGFASYLSLRASQRRNPADLQAAMSVLAQLQQVDPNNPSLPGLVQEIQLAKRAIEAQLGSQSEESRD